MAVRKKPKSSAKKIASVLHTRKLALGILITTLTLGTSSLFVVSSKNKNRQSRGNNILGYVLGDEDKTNENDEKENSNESEKDEGEDKTKETKEPKEVTESEEIKETKEPKEPKELEQEYKDNETEKKNTREIEVKPEKDDTTDKVATISVTSPLGLKTVKKVSKDAETLITNVQDSSGVTVSISVSANGSVVLASEGIKVKTDLPIVIDPKTNSIQIVTKSGNKIAISSSPSSAFLRVPSGDRPTVISSSVLGLSDNEPYYEFSGNYETKLLNMIPINPKIKTFVDANTGRVISIKKPWYLNKLGFLFKMID